MNTDRNRNSKIIEPDAERIVTARARLVAFGLAILLGVSTLAALTTALVLEIQAGATAYIVGEGHWSKARQDAVKHLYVYSINGDEQHLQRVREALAVPLGDRAARLALERSPPDLDAAREGFLAGGNDPDDISRLIWMYRWFSDQRFFRDAVDVWREADDHILSLAALAQTIEELVIQHGIEHPRLPELRAEVLGVAMVLRPMELEFSSILARGARWLHSLLLAASTCAFLILAAVAVTVLVRTMRQIRESEGEFRAAFEQAMVGMAKLDMTGHFVEVNDALCRILDRSRDSLLSIRLQTLIDDEPDTASKVSSQWFVDFGIPTERQVLRGDGSRRWLRWMVSPISGIHNRPDRVLAVVEDVSEARELVDEISHQASHDALTGLANRRETERRLERCLDSARRLGQRHALCFLDLDQFKLINDSCGHAAGDQLLHRLGKELASRLRASDCLGRLGGDEFAIVLERTPLDGAVRVAEKLRDAIAGFDYRWEGRRLAVTGSIGVVEINDQTPDLDWLMAAADTACYMAKDDGRDRVRVYVETDLAVARRRGQMELAGDLRDQIADGRLNLYAQEIRAIGARADAGLRYELLVRLIDGTGRTQTPGAFLAAAERYQLAETIDRAVVSMALAELARHPEHLARLCRCHINVSAQSVASPEFRAFLGSLLDAGPIPAERLCFEISETAAIGNLARTRAFISDLHERGCQIALDDFGSGMASFAHLKSLPVDLLKIDGTFVRDGAKDDDDQSMLRAICQVGRTLGLPTIAEWVETPDLLQRLADIGVDFVQGWAIHRPCPFAEILTRHPGAASNRGDADGGRIVSA